MATLATGNIQMQEGLGHISVENSKFLGGDLQHTHLVKGLDYALLQKVGIAPCNSDGDCRTTSIC